MSFAFASQRIQYYTLIKRLVIQCVLLVFTGFLSPVNSQPAYTLLDSIGHSDMYLTMRASLFKEPMKKWGITQGYGTHAIYGVLMELGAKNSSTLLVSLLDGATSLYVGKSTTIIGGEKNDSIKQYAQRFVQAADQYFPLFSKTDIHPFPLNGVWTFYVLTATGVYSASIKNNDLSANKGMLYPYFCLGDNVLTQIRLFIDPYAPKSFSLQEFKSREKQYYNDLLSKAAYNNDITLLKRTIDDGADIDAQDSNGVTALMRAAYKGNWEIVRELINHKCNFEVKDCSGYTALCYAANAGKILTVKELVISGANVNAVDTSQNTVIAFAAQYGYNDVVAFLFEKGADPNKKNNAGISAVDLAKLHQFKEIVRILSHKK